MRIVRHAVASAAAMIVAVQIENRDSPLTPQQSLEQPVKMVVKIVVYRQGSLNNGGWQFRRPNVQSPGLVRRQVDSPLARPIHVDFEP